MKTLILGIGNTIRCDDGVGIKAVRRLGENINPKSVDIKETSEVGLNLLDLMIGYQKAIIIDAIYTKEGKVGDIYRFSNKNLTSFSNLYSFHSTSLPSLLALAKKMKIPIPNKITYYAIKIEKGDSFGEGLTPGIRKVIFKVVNLIKKEVDSSVELDTNQNS